MKRSFKPWEKFFVPVDPMATTVVRGLAKEIGLNESMVLCQLAYLLAIWRHRRDGNDWVYMTLEEWHDTFPYWSLSTISRIMANLEQKGLILRTNQYNNSPYDKTTWYAINLEGLKRLKSIIAQDECDQDEPTQDEPTQDDGIHFSECKMDDPTVTNRGGHDDKSIHDITTDIATESSSAAPAQTMNKKSKKQDGGNGSGDQDGIDYSKSLWTQRHKFKRHPALQIYIDECGSDQGAYLTPAPGSVEWKLIVESIDTGPAELTKWREAVRAWIGNGHSRRNIVGMIDWYRTGRRDKRPVQPQQQTNKEHLDEELERILRETEAWNAMHARKPAASMTGGT